MANQRTIAAPTLTDRLFDKAGVGLCLVAPDGTVVRANSEWLRSTGFTGEQVVGENIVGLFPDTRDMALAMHARARAGHRVEVPRHVQTMNGRETWWEGSIEPVALGGGTGLLIAVKEVSRGVEERFRAFFDTVAVGAAELGLDGRFISVNDRLCDLTGYSRDELLQMRPADFTHPDDRAREDVRLSAYLTGASPTYQAEERYVRKDGVTIWVQVSAVMVRDASGRPSRSAVVIQDITDRKRAEQNLRRHELVVQQIRDIILFVRHEGGRILEGNPAATEAYGYSREELLDLAIYDLRAPETRALVDLQMAQTDVRGLLFESVHQRKDGSTFPVEVSSRGVTVDGTRILVSVVRDITERKRAEEALRSSEEHLRAAFEASPDAINVNRLRDGIYTVVNDGFARLSGWSVEEAVGRTALELNVWVDLEERAHFMRRLFGGEPVQNEEVSFRRKDGSVFTASISARTFVSKGEQFLLAITRDISDLKRAEQTLREANCRKDEFLGMLSHELRNPLAPIRNSTYILQHAGPGSEQAHRARAVIQRQTEHLTRLVDDLLDVTRIARGKIELRRSPVDLRDVVWRAADDFRFVLRDRWVRFDVNVPEEQFWGEVDATRVTQVVSNLLHNASKFTRRGDEVSLTLGADATFAIIRVRDTGAGIDPALLPRVFEPFIQGESTLARTEGGLGLGLALVKGIAELHGGSAEARSAGKGHGAELIVRLPLLTTLQSDAPAEPRSDRRNGDRRVLVVDDNTDAAESLADLVRMLGHSVDVAYDGPTAIEKARVNPPEVVLCDIGLPEMDGYAVARAMRADPALGRVALVAVSGYAQPEDVAAAKEAGFDAHLAKPPSIETIEQALAEVGREGVTAVGSQGDARSRPGT